VGEVVLTVQFDRDLVDLDVLAAFTNVVREELPGMERQPVMPPVRESFDVPQMPPQFEITIDPSYSLPRTWFISSDGTQLVQLQPDRLSLNWRRLGDASRYPRFRNLRKDFRRYLATLQQCVSERSTMPIQVNMSEVTYVNPIEVSMPPQGGGHPPLSSILNRIRPRPRAAFLPHVEDAQFQTRWRIPGSEIGVDGRPAGRLYFTASPGLKPPDGVPIYVVTLTGRVLPAGESERAALDAMDVAHRWVVLGFKDLTTDKMHQQWGYTERG
jgi:uncharacterized protein (TIGR04255 family)